MSNPSPNDIPSARRQPSEISASEIESITFFPKRKRRKRKLAIALFFIAGLITAALWQWDWLSPHLGPVGPAVERGRDYVAQAATDLGRREAPADRTARTATPEIPSRSEASTPPSTAAEEPSAQTPSNITEDELLGHRRYEIADESTLVRLNPDSDLLFKPDVRDTIERMIEKARIEGVQLGVISGFRSIEDQNHLYFDIKAERGQSVRTRAEVSAPPGYSEHHTGYAIDFIDPSTPSTHLSVSFEDTDTFRWLVKNAPYFNLEMSFPKDNESGVQYEPWHWRYVGNQESLELFYREQ